MKGTVMNLRTVCCSILLTLAAGCARSGAGNGEITGIPEVELKIALTIGEETGDSNYVFGNLLRIDHDLQGNILALDRLEACIKVYSPDGVFLRRISREGSGPGELLNPFDMTVTARGNILVETPYSGGLHSFSTDGEWLGLVTPFFSNPPTGIWGGDGISYVAVRNEVLPDENGNLICNPFIGRYENGEEPVVKYWESTFPFDPNDLTGVMRNGIRSHSFCADREGNVFLARRTPDSYLVQGYRPGGELFLEIDREPCMVERSPAEIAEEEEFIESSLRSSGSSGVVLEYESEPYRDQIADMGVDGEGGIWVRRGTEFVPTFDVYDYEGNLKFTATVPAAGEDAMYWKFIIDEQGILAYSLNPVDYQRVFVLEMP